MCIYYGSVALQVQSVAAAPYCIPYSAPASFERRFKQQLPDLYAALLESESTSPPPEPAGKESMLDDDTADASSATAEHAAEIPESCGPQCGPVGMKEVRVLLEHGLIACISGCLKVSSRFRPFGAPACASVGQCRRW